MRLENEITLNSVRLGIAQMAIFVISTTLAKIACCTPKPLKMAPKQRQQHATASTRTNDVHLHGRRQVDQNDDGQFVRVFQLHRQVGIKGQHGRVTGRMRAFHIVQQATQQPMKGCHTRLLGALGYHFGGFRCERVVFGFAEFVLGIVFVEIFFAV